MRVSFFVSLCVSSFVYVVVSLDGSATASLFTYFSVVSVVPLLVYLFVVWLFICVSLG